MAVTFGRLGAIAIAGIERSKVTARPVTARPLASTRETESRSGFMTGAGSGERESRAVTPLSASSRTT